jgi:hypothetical protein
MGLDFDVVDLDLELDLDLGLGLDFEELEVVLGLDLGVEVVDLDVKELIVELLLNGGFAFNNLSEEEEAVGSEEYKDS